MDEYRILNIEDLLIGSSSYEYLNTTLYITDGLKELFQLYPTFKPNFFGIIFCKEGYLQFNINGKEYLLSKNELCIFFPTKILSNTIFSSDCEISFIGISQVFFNNIIHKDKNEDDTIAYIINNPVLNLHLSHKGKTAIGMLVNFIKGNLCSSDNPYKKELMHHIVSAIICEILNINNKRNINNCNRYNDENASRKEVFKKFIQEVTKDNGRHRSVSYYADLLCYTPKYISFCVKSVSEQNALIWINEHTIELIKYRLTNSTLSIKEIANEFNFATPAFFGQYVKKHTGFTPGEYRKSAIRLHSSS